MKKQSKPKRKTARDYIKNEDIMPLIFEYRATGEVSNDLGDALLTIARNYANKGNFHGYTWKEDMVSEAVLTCIKYMHNFDPMRYSKPNPFAYFTSIIRNAFLNYIRKQKKHSEIKDWCYNHYEMMSENTNDHYANKGIDYTVLKKD
jgi:DNA-directed RNA polymerase specialized sigma24 family protein